MLNNMLSQPLMKLVRQKKLLIKSSIPELPFIPEKQIDENSVNLRLHPQAKRLKENVEIDFRVLGCLDNDNFEEVVLTDEGYLLRPGDALFCQTLEMLYVMSSNHVGMVVGRTKVAAYGISVNFNQIKVPAGLLWNFPLHIQNNTGRDVRIYPFVKVAQLMVFPYPYGKHYKPEGDYHDIDFLSHLGVSQNERDELNDALTIWGKHKSGYLFKVNQKGVVDKLKMEEKGYWKLRRTFLNSDFVYSFAFAVIIAIVPAIYLYRDFDISPLFIAGLGLVICMVYAIARASKK